MEIVTRCDRTKTGKTAERAFYDRIRNVWKTIAESASTSTVTECRACHRPPLIGRRAFCGYLRQGSISSTSRRQRTIPDGSDGGRRSLQALDT
ncbi:hypothetical protein GWI33_014545 [Rhynchophorus ferrugineus]|uniref:Uncharacterized protein n=1 Tax=Rhynchophorus ferrugineus TaxID=354439 RepID=A0A834M8Z9_RHYFE|nr:hypothetical protein GWI33_014545 [Rhynchophorus ferrugineus]